MGIKKDCLPHEITIYHKLGEVNKIAKFHPTIIKLVRLEQRIAISQKLKGQSTYDTFKIYIDTCNSVAYWQNNRRTYLSRHTFKSLSQEEQQNYWTISEGDYIITKAIDDSEFSMNIEELKKAMRVYTVNAFVPVYDKKGLHHWEVSGRGKILE